MKAPTAFIVVSVTLLLVLVTIVHLKGPPPATESDAPVPTSAVLHGYDRASEGHPDKFAQYHNAIRSSAEGVNEYPAGYKITEFGKAFFAAKTTRQLPWIERGPGNVGGRMRPLLVDPDDPSRLPWYAGSVSGGLWKTSDGGATWHSLTDHLPNLAVVSLAMGESNRDVMYMGTGEGFGDRAVYAAVAGNGIFKTTDRGQTWTHLESTISDASFRWVNRLAVDPANASVVLAATGAGIFRSTDGGMSWASVNSVANGKQAQYLQPQPGNFNMQMASINGRGILYSEDAGRTWQQAALSVPIDFGRNKLAYSPSKPSIAYAAVAPRVHNSADGGELFYSADAGRTWQRTHDSRPLQQYD